MYFQYTLLKLKMQSHMTANSVHLSKTAVIYDYVMYADDTAASCVRVMLNTLRYVYLWFSVRVQTLELNSHDRYSRERMLLIS